MTKQSRSGATGAGAWRWLLAILALAMPGAGAAAQGGAIQRPGEIQQPKGTWQKPGEIQQPKGTWQKPGEIQVPQGIQAIKTQASSCEQRLSTVADALFEFNQSALSPAAGETLAALGPLIAKQGEHPLVIEGHTDSIGSDSYNQRLSERRAEAVKSWLVAHRFVPAATPAKGYGKNRPVAPNTNPDGSDNPAGRQQNRRVEVVVKTCP
jgi:outer membrane protein OmpA-like peptidoglycan-associated protein